jgi:hypothetical protein
MRLPLFVLNDKTPTPLDCSGLRLSLRTAVMRRVTSPAKQIANAETTMAIKKDLQRYWLIG